MTSERQSAANRRNAAWSTGPRTARGKLRSRRNAYRHGLTAETVITSLEDSGEYQRFEAGLFDDYTPQGAVERELVARLASLLWRVRRATLIETGLFEMQGGALQQRHRDQSARESNNPALEVFYRFLHGTPTSHLPEQQTEESVAPAMSANSAPIATRNDQRMTDMALVYLELSHSRPGVMKRVGRYEAAIWRQLAQTLLILEKVRSAGLHFRN